MQVQHGRECLGGRDALLTVVAETRQRPGLVVVAPVQGVPSPVGEPGLPVGHGCLERPEIELPWVVAVGAEVELHVLELEHHVELTAGRAGEAGCLRDGHAGHLPDCEYVRVPACEHLPVHLPEELVIARPASEEAARK